MRHPGSRRDRRPAHVPAALLPLSLTVAVAFALATSTRAVDRHASPAGEPAVTNTPAATPPMGWNDWAHYECAVDEGLILDQARALVATGLAAKGYRTVTIDDCWPARSRDAAGDLVADPAKFPHGMAYVAKRVHALGLDFGIYEDAGTSTCGGYPGSWDHWRQDAETFASWGVDYLKLDGCNVPNVPGRTREQTYRTAYADMSRALAATGRHIVFSESAPAYFQNTPDWYTVLGWVGRYGQLWREGADIRVLNPSHPDLSRWSSVLANYGYNSGLARYAKPGNWNDPDFLIAGDSGLTPAESRSQLALWAMMAAPLNLSLDVTKLSPASIDVLGDTAVIAVDQDPLGRQGAVVSRDGTVDVLDRPLAGGDRAVALLNRSGSTVSASTSVTDIGFRGGAGCDYRVENLWTGASTTTRDAITASVSAHDTAIFRVRPAPGCAAAQPAGQISDATGKCLGTTSASLSHHETAGLAAIGVADCAADAGRHWTLPGDGTVRAVGGCLDVADPSDTAESSDVGAAVVLDRCDGAEAQRWLYRHDGRLVNSATGSCLTLTDRSEGSGGTTTAVDLAECGGIAADQVWSLPV